MNLRIELVYQLMPLGNSIEVDERECLLGKFRLLFEPLNECISLYVIEDIGREHIHQILFQEREQSVKEAHLSFRDDSSFDRRNAAQAFAVSR